MQRLAAAMNENNSIWEMLFLLRRGTSGLGTNFAVRQTTSTGPVNLARPFTPGNTSGKPLLAFDITPLTTGLLQVVCQFLVASTATDTMQLDGIYVPSLTAITGGSTIALGVVGEPTSLTGGTPVTVGTSAAPSFSGFEAANGMFCSITFPVQAVVGQRTGIYVNAKSLSNITWDQLIQCTGSVTEIPLAA